MSDKALMPSVAAQFFYGAIDESHAFPFPEFNDNQKEMGREMTGAVSRFCHDSINSEKQDSESKIPDEIMQGLAELGLYGLAVGEEYGGMNLDYSLYARVFSEIAGVDGSVATMLGAHQSIGYRALLNEGNAEQKAKWLPRLASGECLASFCLTEPGSGSDAYSIKTKATDNGNGTYTINGQKLWITNAGKAEFYSVFCKTDHKGSDGKTVEKISCFIVEKSFPGVSFGEKENKMGIRASETRAVYFDKVVVPKENIIGELGMGFKIAMNVLNSGRLSLGSGCVGGMKSIIKLAVEHANNRKQFDRPIKEFGLIQEKLAFMAAHCYATESIVYMTTGNINRGMKEYQLESAICKVFGSEALWRVVDTGMQIAAGNGYMKEYPYERMMRDSRINLIFEGTNEILRCFIALAGIREPGESLKEVGKLTDPSRFLNDPIKSLGVLSSYAKNRVTKMIGGKSLTKVHPSFEEEAVWFSEMLSHFSIQVENTLFKYGKTIIGNEMPQGRIANMAIDLYVMLSVLSRSTFILESKDIDQERKDYISMLTRLICENSHGQFNNNLRRMNKNKDELIQKISDKVAQDGGYKFDILNY